MREAVNGELNIAANEETNTERRGKVLDLILPVVFLIAFSILSMLYTGGLFEGASIGDAFANCDAILGLAMGIAYSVIFVELLYLPRKIVTPKEILDRLV
ncbi:MAG: hypothetical protein PUG00_07560 [Clostridiales bacterium]|nr:hypothetical protein [Clostridiales bacterium]